MAGIALGHDADTHLFGLGDGDPIALGVTMTPRPRSESMLAVLVSPLRPSSRDGD